jgi:hypothetical protein
MIQSTRFKSLKQTVQNALSQLYKKVNRLTLRLLRAVADNHLILVFILIAGAYLFDIAFTLFEFDVENPKKYHPFYDGIVFKDGSRWNGWVTQANFVYGFMDIIYRVLLCLSVGLAIYFGVRTYIYFVIAGLEFFDLFDYWLIRNGAWFTMHKFLIFDNWEFEFNYIKIGFVLTFCYTEWKRLKYTGSLG